MPETVEVQRERVRGDLSAADSLSQQNSLQSFGELWASIRRHQRLFLGIVWALVAACFLYCLIAPNVYEATARVALRGTQVSLLTVDHSDGGSSSFASGQVQLETLANELRSGDLAWNVITELKLYEAAGFRGRFAEKFPDFFPSQSRPDARDWLLERFQSDLTVQTIPRTLVLEIRFRSRDAALSAAIVNALIHVYEDRIARQRIEATNNATQSLRTQLRDLKSHEEQDEEQLSVFQKQHGILNAPETLGNGQPTEVEHSADLSQVDALSRELANATTDRVVLEAEYRAAVSGDPEIVIASDPKLVSANSSATALLQQLRARKSDLRQEEAQLRVEHGENFPRAVEIRSQAQEIEQQINEEDKKLLARLKSSWDAANDRVRMVRKSLADATSAGMKVNEAALRYSAMRQEANAHRDLYIRLNQQAEEATLAASSRGSDLIVIDYAHQPVSPFSPNLPVLLSITVFISLWCGLAAVSFKEAIRAKAARVAIAAALAVTLAGVAHGQAPTPSTSGLPTGVARIPQSTEIKSTPNAKDAPAVWNLAQGTGLAGVPPGAGSGLGLGMAAPIAPGDLLEVSESHTPEMRSSVRVTQQGTVTLMLAGEIQVSGLDETAAAHAIQKALIERGMLLHPQVVVMVTAYAGQDVTILGEVARPGVYAYPVHHRLLDLISAASGLSPSAGRLVTIAHRDQKRESTSVALDPEGRDNTTDHNPELLPGDIVQVNRAGLVYVVGDVVRPGAFPVDPVHPTTVVQAVSLAWGPGQNAALTKAVLIREQPGGRTITTLNLKRLLRGQEPDVPIRDRDIVFVPDSMAKNLLNRTMESVIQSAAGVSIYAGMVYSQRF